MQQFSSIRSCSCAYACTYSSPSLLRLHITWRSSQQIGLSRSRSSSASTGGPILGMAQPPLRAAQCVSGRSSSAVAATAASMSVEMTDLSEFAALANELADTAAAVTTPYFRSQLVIDNKSDESPVTIADREAEAAMRRVLSSRAPDHAVFGEEEGMSRGAGEGPSPWLWVLDPIDGTKSFITGKPVYGTLIALLHNGVPVLGIIDQPITKERWLGIAGQPTTLNSKPIKSRKCPGGIGNAYLYATTPHMFQAPGVQGPWNRVKSAAKLDLYGCDCYAYGLLAAGFVDLVVEADMKPYDFLAMVPIIQGAGGAITNWSGETIHWACTPAGDYALNGLAGEVLAAGDPAVHAEALRVLDFKQ